LNTDAKEASFWFSDPCSISVPSVAEFFLDEFAKGATMPHSVDWLYQRKS
jgi:hypothetical protein